MSVKLVLLWIQLVNQRSIEEFVGPKAYYSNFDDD